MPLVLGAVTVVCATLAACAPAELTLAATPPDAQATVHLHVARTQNRRLDLLVVPDDGVRPFDEGSPWADWLTALGKALEGVSTSSLHVAVLPATDDGVCFSQGTGAFAFRDGCGHTSNLRGSLGPTLACAVDAARSAPTYLPPLAALEAFATSSSARPAGFLRQTSRLLVLVLSGHDDVGSGEDALSGRRVREALDAFVPNPTAFAIAVVGPRACREGPPPRLAPDLAGLTEAYVGLCQPNDESVAAVISLLSPPIYDGFGFYCLPSPVRDSDPNAPGLQPVISVSDASYREEDEGLVLEAKRDIPACDGTTRPCWQIGSWQCPGDQFAAELDPAACSSEEVFTLDYETCVSPTDPACARAHPLP